MSDARSRIRLVLVVSLLVATAAVYWQVGTHDFLSYDDKDYVSANRHVLPGLTTEGIRWAFTTGAMGNWHPLAWLSLMVDCQIVGANPGAIHLINLLFHLVNCALLLLVLERATGALGKSAFVAGLFALHPLHVESVAWIAERKDVLSTLLWILAMGSYVLYAERPGPGRLLKTLALFALGLMAKPMLVTLPFVLLLLDYWPLGRVPAPLSADGLLATGTEADRLAPAGRDRRSLHEQSPPTVSGALDSSPSIDRAKLGTPSSEGAVILSLVREKAPFFALTAVCSIVAFLTQRGAGVVASTDLLPLGQRMANAVVSYAEYLVKMVWPARLAIIYPHPGMPPGWQMAGAAALLLVVSALVASTARRRPYLAVGWLWYLGTLIPVIGLVQVGAQALADRYTYVPLIGVFIMVAWGVPDLLPPFAERAKALTAVACVVLAACAYGTWVQTGYWKNNMTLFRHALAVTSYNVIAHNNLGIALGAQGRGDEAIEQFEAARRIKSDHVQTNNNLAVALANQGRLEEAIRYYRAAIETDPKHAETHFNLANALLKLGRKEEALAHLTTAATLKPEFVEAHYNLGGLLMEQGKLDEAARQFSEVLRLDPSNDGARRSLTAVLAKQGRSEPE